MARPRALVTGASSGIGDAYARRLAEDGYDLVVVARRRDRLLGLAQLLRDSHGTDVAVEVVDLSSPSDLDRLVAAVPGFELDLLVNNAGFGAYAPFVRLDPDRAVAQLRVHVVAPTMLARAALPGMIERGRGAVVNVASALAFSGGIAGQWLPARATYAATKSYLVTFSQILASELEGTRVLVQALCPPTTATEFHEVQGIDLSHVKRMTAEDVVSASIAALGTGEVICLPGTVDPQAVADWSAAAARLLRG